jgi:2-polyprenyl-6-methoxyphenol hydroxylase-like FAD-dependent oxidoreductase
MIKSMSRNVEQIPLLIIGAGPVGMCAAIEAAQRGIPVTVIESRKQDTPPSAKCNTVASRTLEIFRRFGFAEKVRAAGLPDSYPTDSVFCSSLAGPELTRISMPSRSERKLPGFPDSAWRTPEPVVRVSQIYLEPIIYAHMRSMPNITVLYETSFEGYTQDEHGVDVLCKRADGEIFNLNTRYLVGADGGRSAVRKRMGVRLSGDSELGHIRSSLIRAPGINALWGSRRPAWMSWTVNHKVRGIVVAIDGQDTWLVHRSLPSGVTDFEALDRDQSIRDVLGVDADFSFEILSHEDWVGRRLVADCMRDGRVFIAGDAAHLWVPMAGYGMNAGIADGVHIAWLISNVLQGWASEGMLDAYEAERQPITDQVSRKAMQVALDYNAATADKQIPVYLASRYNPISILLRKILGKKLHAMNVPQFAPEGLNFGYYYDASPIITYDGSAHPDYDMSRITHSTVPGCRMPHFYLPDGSSVYDQLGAAYTLIRFDPQAEIRALTQAATSASMPIAVLDTARPQDSSAFTHALLIVRQDQHVAWRGNALPQNCNDLIFKLCGFNTQISAHSPALSS